MSTIIWSGAHTPCDLSLNLPLHTHTHNRLKQWLSFKTGILGWPPVVSYMPIVVLWGPAWLKFSSEGASTTVPCWVPSCLKNTLHSSSLQPWRIFERLWRTYWLHLQDRNKYWISEFKNICYTEGIKCRGQISNLHAWYMVVPYSYLGSETGWTETGFSRFFSDHLGKSRSVP